MRKDVSRVREAEREMRDGERGGVRERQKRASDVRDTLLFYLCIASQMVLLGFYHDSTLFPSLVTSIYAGAHGGGT